ncbi:MAG: DUF4412 domain-containing protein [Gemmatimonadaceae bacterium]|nr:DUF4412 domain-containing protein [Gemmatimonadaceae bacterium]
MPVAATRLGTPARFLAVTLLLVGTIATLAAARTPSIPPVARPAAAGLTFTYTVTSASTDKRRKESMDINALVQLQGGNARMDYTNGKGPMGQKGAYIIITSSPAQFAIVNDKDKQVMVMDAGQFGSGLGAMMNNPMMKMSINNAKFSFKDMGAGENILGYRTRHVRMYNSSDIEVKIMGMTQRSSSSDSSDQWIAQGIEIDEEALAVWGRSFTSGMKATNPEMAAEFAKYEKEYGRKGMALRSTTWSTTTDGKGKVTTDIITMEVTDLKKGNVDPAVFKIPEGYQVTNLSETMKAAQSAMDSAKGADTTKGKGAKPSAGDAIKAGLGGMFKKKPPQ